MTRKSILAAGLMMVASLAQAEVLSWMVDIDSGNSSYATAQLFATTTAENYWTTGSSQSGQINKYDDTYGVVTYDSNLSVGDTYSFYVKLFASDGTTMVGYSGLLSWSQLVSDGALVSGTVPDFPATTPWNAGTSVVPEPTAMALLAMGASALLLRRRRVA